MKPAQEQYIKIALPSLKEKFGYKSVIAAPRISKITVSSGAGKLVAQKTSDEQKKTIQQISENIAQITGQKPIVTKAKKSISAFKLRQGMPIGVKVVLRGKKMYDFFYRLVNIAIPRLRDFRGIDKKCFDNQGNLTIGFKEQTIFPEISPEEARILFGFEVTIATTAKKKEEGVELMKLLGFPLKKEK
ncbi:MAG: 50S ribosomal protein L5 [Candidatus Nealsonbacteria bacterium RIFOXYB1_FULL_40_15]|uniref:Large ribosomal subunit protein uL5 n=2 Tax=Candidatus Nealsoniibacteriota TaxID=1817911 RepID=A0A1G2ELN7_9BACT|nr:MAG: 50S ribosomal protein L5 [Candidatus Nealsonbacteria bacterium RIFOXYC1_FULL_40_7]OGZ27847.1 MAG: 50S ribosomal protein L5 [Candidatus Nealsonbacteria bacterium RIFOXYB1_FULL_40_15]